MHQAKDQPSNMARSECRKNCSAAGAGSGEPQVLKWRDVGPVAGEPGKHFKQRRDLIDWFLEA